MGSLTKVIVDEEWISGNQRCAALYSHQNYPGHCRAVWDRYLCWPPTPPGQPARIRCPQSSSHPGVDTSKYAYRMCSWDGLWEGKVGSSKLNDSIGWTNYTQCFSKGIQDLLAVLNQQSELDLDRKLTAAAWTRILEMVGLSVSMISLILSLFIFCRFRNLWNNRTRIHRNLFIAMLIQVLVRLIVYIDQYISRSAVTSTFTADGNSSSPSAEMRRGIDNTEYVCESFYFLLEYARTAMFLWMLVEGIVLHNMITVAVFQEYRTAFYHCLGWGSPLLLTLIWAIVTSEKFHGIVCWWGYNLSPYFWILEGPRLTVIVLNLIFLLNIIRVLVTKLRESNSTEALQVRKAVRAAIVLLPLLGITNSLQMLHSPVDKDAMQFALWSYFTAFLTSFQGFFCALIYCFLNGEVQASVRRCFRGWRHHGNRTNASRRRSVGAGASIHLKTHLEATVGAKKKDSPKRNGTNSDESRQSRNAPIDPLKQWWTEAELSSHNNVDIEHIEIPVDYYVKHGHNRNRCESTLPLVPGSGTTTNTLTTPVLSTSK